MTKQDILQNPGLFADKYRRMQEKISSLQQKNYIKDNRISDLRALLKKEREKNKIFEAKEAAKKNRGEKMALRNKMEDLFYHIQPYYPTMTLETVMNRGRKREVVEARSLMYYFLRDKYQFSWNFISAIMGGFDHSTVIHGYEQVENWAAYNPEFRKKFNEIKKNIDKVH